MQYQQFLKRSQKVDVGSHPLNFQGHSLCDNPKTPLPPANLRSQSEPHFPNKRERYRTRLIAEISSLRVAGKDHLKRYILHKFRNNCKRNTIRGAFTNAVKFLKFIQNYRHRELETLRRSDIEDFVQFELPNASNPNQNMGISIDCDVFGDEEVFARVDLFNVDGNDETRINGVPIDCNAGELRVTVRNDQVQMARVRVQGVPQVQTLIEYTLVVAPF